MFIVLKSTLTIFFIITFTGCSTIAVKSPDNLIGYTESGKAAYYAMKFQSRKTASGERFNQSSKTAAHKKLPFGTKVKVTNIKNGKSVIVRINDRGLFIKGRIIDLSKLAFSRIGNTDSGVINVRIEVVK